MSDLIEPTELAHLLSAAAESGSRDSRPDEAPAVLDVRWQLGGPSSYQAYLEGHVPTAQWVDLEQELCDPPGPAGRHPLPSEARLISLFDRLRLGTDRAVVVYDTSDSSAAARAWWTLRWAGLTDVRVLDGGFGGWRSQALPVESGSGHSARRPASAATPRPGALPTLDADGSARLAAQGRLVDARARNRYLGVDEPVDPVAGRIPGARSVPTAGNVDGSGRFLAPALLRERFSDLGNGTGAVGAYCGSGITAAHTVLAMKLAGIDAVLYPGSWSEWITDPSRPVETGEPPAP